VGLASRLSHVGLSLHFAQQQAVARMYSMLLPQAQAISCIDVYWFLAASSVLMFFLSFVLAKNEPGNRRRSGGFQSNFAWHLFFTRGIFYRQQQRGSLWTAEIS